MIFDGPKGLRYDTAKHDFVEPGGELASAERVANAWGKPVEEVEQDRAWRATKRNVTVTPLGNGMFRYEIGE